MSMPPFHLAFAVHDLAATERFYVDVLGCHVGRRAERWIDFDFHGHQISAHLAEVEPPAGVNEVDGDDVPTRHFGVVLPWRDWEAAAERMRAADVEFLIAPRVRFRDEPGEQGTFFVRDPSGNAIEMKSFRDPSRLFAT